MYTEKQPGIQPGGDSSGYTNLGTALRMNVQRKHGKKTFVENSGAESVFSCDELGILDYSPACSLVRAASFTPLSPLAYLVTPL